MQHTNQLAIYTSGVKHEGRWPERAQQSPRPPQKEKKQTEIQ